MTDDGLIAQAQQFATEISETIQGLVPRCAPFTAVAVQSRVNVEQSPATGIPLRVKGRPLLTLKVSYRCVSDTSGDFLAVEKSSFEVYEGAKRPVSRSSGTTTSATRSRRFPRHISRCTRTATRSPM